MFGFVAQTKAINAAVAGLLARRFARKATPPTPTQAVEEAQRTVTTLRSHV